MQPASLPARYSPRVALLGVLVTAALLAPIASSPVAAANPAEQLSSVRAQVDQLRSRLQALDKELTQLHGARARIERSYATEHRLAVRRAVARYTENTTLQDDAASVMQAAGTNVILERAAEKSNAAMEQYIRTRSPWLDLKLLLLTVPAVVLRRGAH